jgi:hypothetical protein
MPLFVVTATHSSDQCPMSNTKTRKLFHRSATERTKAAQKSGVKILVGPIFSINHKTIVVAEASKVESVMDMLTELRVPQWNTVDVQPYMTAEDAAKIVDMQEALY